MLRGRGTGLIAAAAALVAVALPAAASAAPGPARPTTAPVHGDDFHHGRPREIGVAVPAGRLTPGRRAARRLSAAGARRPLDETSQFGLGVRRAAVLRIAFAGETGAPVTASKARTVLFTAPTSVAALLSEETAGAVTLTGLERGDGDVFGPFTVPAPTGCAPYDWAAAARAAAADTGLDLDPYDHVVVAFPDTGLCAWSGLGEVGGSLSWINGSDSFVPRVVAHELSHNLGAYHAGTWRCLDRDGRRVALGGLCRPNDEYGDPFDLMGSGASRHVQTFFQSLFGWLAPEEQLTVGTDGEYTLSPNSAPGTGTRLIQIRRPANTPICLEFRQPTGTPFEVFAPGDPGVNGVIARLCPSASHSRLIDANPATATYADAPIARGETLVDPGTQIVIHTTAVSAFGATVRIAFGDHAPPTAPGPVTAVAAPGSVRLTWPAASDDVAVGAYRVSRNGVPLATVGPPSAVDLAPREGAVYEVRAVDVVGNVGPPSTSAPVRLPDVTPPTAPTSLVARPHDRNALHVEWAAASDAGGIRAYRVALDGVVVATVPGTVVELDGLAPGVHRVEVSAVDAAGNVGRSAAVEVTIPVAPVPPSPAARVTVPGGVPGPDPDGVPTLDGLRLDGVGRTAVALRWVAARPDRGLAGYVVYRDGRRVDSTRSTSYVDTGLGGGERHLYSIRVADRSGTLGPAASIEVTTRRASGRIAISRAELQRTSRGGLLVVTAATFENLPPGLRCGYRLGTERWRPCRFAADGTATIRRRLPDARPVRLTVRSVDRVVARTWYARRTLRP